MPSLSALLLLLSHCMSCLNPCHVMLPLRMNSLSDLYLCLLFIHCIFSLSWHLHCGHAVNILSTLASALRFLSGIMKRKKTHNKEKSIQQLNRFLQLKSRGNHHHKRLKLVTKSPHKFSSRSTWGILNWGNCLIYRYADHIWKPLEEYWALQEMSSSDSSTCILPESFICFSGYFTKNHASFFSLFFSYLFFSLKLIYKSSLKTI